MELFQEVSDACCCTTESCNYLLLQGFRFKRFCAWKDGRGAQACIWDTFKACRQDAAHIQGICRPQDLAYGPLGYLQVMPAGHQISQGMRLGISHGMLPAPGISPRPHISCICRPGHQGTSPKTPAGMRPHCIYHGMLPPAP